MAIWNADNILLSEIAVGVPKKRWQLKRNASQIPCIALSVRISWRITEYSTPNPNLSKSMKAFSSSKLQTSCMCPESAEMLFLSMCAVLRGRYFSNSSGSKSKAYWGVCLWTRGLLILCLTTSPPNHACCTYCCPYSWIIWFRQFLSFAFRSYFKSIKTPFLYCSRK